MAQPALQSQCAGCGCQMQAQQEAGSRVSRVYKSWRMALL